MTSHVRAAGVAAAGVLALAGCGGGSETPAAPAAARVEIADFEFAPPTVRVAGGARVTFVNRDRASHTATGPGIDTGRLKQGQSAVVTAPASGRVAYVCAFHPLMKGTIEVE